MYIGPHKWIVCLIGSEAYTVSDFMLRHETAIRKMKNMSISIMGLSSEPLRCHNADYRQLTRATREGDYMNIVDMDTAKVNAKKFFSASDVYPSNEIPAIREFFSKV